jgi:hypothetical protein
MRQLVTSSHEEKLRNIEAGLSMAREAVQLDTTDGLSWSILGNAYFAHFFNVSQNPRTLKQSMSAYIQAVCTIRLISCNFRVPSFENFRVFLKEQLSAQVTRAG